MGKMTALYAATKLREENTRAVLMFISQYNEYTTDGYRVDAFRYILKPTLSSYLKKEY